MIQEEDRKSRMSRGSMSNSLNKKQEETKL
jgi:hypothetical protein